MILFSIDWGVVCKSGDRREKQVIRLFEKIGKEKQAPEPRSGQKKGSDACDYEISLAAVCHQNHLQRIFMYGSLLIAKPND